MGYSYSTYRVYGAHIPDDWWGEGVNFAIYEGDRLDGVIKSLGNRVPKLSHLSAGKYDQDMFFICVDIEGEDAEVELGSYGLSSAVTVPGLWDAALRLLASEAGYPAEKLVCGWITVPDQS